MGDACKLKFFEKSPGILIKNNFFFSHLSFGLKTFLKILLSFIVYMYVFMLVVLALRLT